MSPTESRRRIAISGAVQGVGFRPFVFRLAAEASLRGFVTNTPQGVVVEVEGPAEAVDRFVALLSAEKPPHASYSAFEVEALPVSGLPPFEIRKSEAGGARTAVVLPDLATCGDCLSEVLDPRDRRHLYPFANCTNCGPRFSIVLALPYDRPNTTMRGFPMCAACRAEYDDPRDRRFHAQPIACPACGPSLTLWDGNGGALSERHEALLAAAEALREGRVVALKGLGGFQLLCDARDDRAVAELRRRKRREEKPFAVMAPSLSAAREAAALSPQEERLLLSPQAPIVLARRRDAPVGIAGNVAPENPNLGLFLPYTPLHHLLLRELGFPLVATSGNLSDEPLATDEREALSRLASLADLFLVHDRPVARPVDDSVVRVIAGEATVLRRARGHAPLPVSLRRPLPPLLSVGAHLKSTVAVSAGSDVFLSQHLGDLGTAESEAAFTRAIADLTALYDVVPVAVACDAHPDYGSTRWAEASGQRVVRVQHHHAHLLSAAAEHGLEGPFSGLSWDGTGWGPDGTVWGGEALRAEGTEFTRVVRLRPFPIPGGDAAVREPRRAALGLLFAAWGAEALASRDSLPWPGAFEGKARPILLRALERGVNAPFTSSVGRLFDAVASLCGLRQVCRFEGQAAMQLEFALHADSARAGAYTLPLRPAPGATDGLLEADWEPLLLALLEDVGACVPLATISARLHTGRVEMGVAAARRAGERTVVLTGGCFQNRALAERAVERLAEEGFDPRLQRRIPPNDGGIALGQLLLAARLLRHES